LRAAQYPERPIKVIVPTTAGSLPDVIARLVGERLALAVGQPIIIENRAGAGGTIGLNAVAKAPADGYTLGIMTSAYIAAAKLIDRVPYEAENDLAPVALIAWNYVHLLVRSDSPVHSVGELITLAKSKPGTLKYSSPGNGTPGHLGMKLFEKQTGSELVHVPYKGSPAATMALLRGDVDIEMVGMLTVEPYVKSGELRPLATTAPRRVASNPDLPTMIELGYAEVNVSDWMGVVAPAGAPVEVVERLSRALVVIAAQPDVNERLQALSMEPAGLGRVEFKRLIHSESKRLSRLIREAHITPE
jgi:tripartite-type tricarboxylate transporter receptor subunit TctC